ncbi:MAG: transposase [Elusimicrobia bacterium]|nr:transposase [Candidatus Liberimonas magnetica]
MARGNNRQNIFLDESDYILFLKLLSEIKIKYPFYLYSYCLMPSHFHLLIEAKETPLSVIMQRLLTGYTVNINRKYKKFGHLFQGRYKAILCQKDNYLLELVRYIHLNPVRAHLAAKPMQWLWSGHNEYLKPSGNSLLDEQFVLEYFSKDKLNARKLYSEFVREGMGMGHLAEMYPPEKMPYVGNEEFVTENVCRHTEIIEKRTPGATFAVISLSAILEDTGKKLGVKDGVIQGPSRNKKAAAARREFVLQAYRSGHKMADIARFLQRTQGHISRLIDREIAADQ